MTRLFLMRLTWAQPGTGTMSLSVEGPPRARGATAVSCGWAIKRQLITRLAKAGLAGVEAAERRVAGPA